MINIPIDDYDNFKQNILNKSLKTFSYVKNKRTFLISIDGPLYFTHELKNSDKDDYQSTIGKSENKKIGDAFLILPFSEKGSNKFKGVGIIKNIKTQSEGNIDFLIPNGVYKYNGIEIYNGDYGDTVNLTVIDSPEGKYSGVPSGTLEEFAKNWNMKKEISKEMQYAATLYSGMSIRVEYANNTNIDKDIYVNHNLHLIS